MSGKFLAPLFVAFYCVVHFAGATDLNSKVPSTAGFVIEINSQKFSDKLGFDKLSGFDFVDAFNDVIEEDTTDDTDVLVEFMKNPGAYGIDLSANSIGFIDMQDTVMAFSYLFALNDAGKFKSFIKDGIIATSDDKTIHKAGKMQYYMAGDLIIMWGKDYAQLVALELLNGISDKDPYYNLNNYMDEELEGKDELEYLSMQNKREKKMREKMLAYLAGSGMESVMENENYALYAAETADLKMWINFESYMVAYQDVLRKEFMYMRSMYEFMDKLTSLYADNYSHAFLDFKKEKVLIRTKYFASEKIQKLFEGMYAKRLNPKALDYISGDSLMFVIGGAIDLNKAVNGYLDLYQWALDNETEEKEAKASSKYDRDVEYTKIASGALDILRIVIDVDRITEVAKGDFLFALTGVKEIEVSYIDYEYDEDYNRIEVEATRKEKMPVFTYMMSMNNEKDFKTIIEAYEKFDLIEKEKNYYKIKERKRRSWEKEKEQNPVYLALENGIFFVTNDEYLVGKKFKKGYEQELQVKGTLKEDLLNHSILINLDFAYIFDKVKDELDEEESDSIDLYTVTELDKHIKTITLKGYEEKGKVLESSLEITLKGMEENSLLEILRIADILYDAERMRELARESYDDIATYEEATEEAAEEEAVEEEETEGVQEVEEEMAE